MFIKQRKEGLMAADTCCLIDRLVCRIKSRLHTWPEAENLKFVFPRYLKRSIVKDFLFIPVFRVTEVHFCSL